VTAFAGEFGETHDDALYNGGLRYTDRETGRLFDRRDTSPSRTDHVVFGVVEVKGQVFTATILPETRASPLLIEYLGFRPLGGGEGMNMLDRQEEEELLKLLEALGYLG